MTSTKTRLALFTACIALAATLSLLASAAAFALPSGWGYELISRADSGGADLTAASGSGDDVHAWINGLTPMSSQQVTGNIDTLAAHRTATGWQLQDLAEPVSDGKSYSYLLVGRSPDGSQSLVEVCERILLGCIGDTRYVRIAADGTRSTILTVPSTNFAQGDPLLVGASSDLSRIVVQLPPAAPPLLPEDTHTQGQGLYVADDGQVAFAGVDEHGAALDCGAVLGNGDNAGFEQTGLSADGATMAYTSPDPSVVCPDPTRELYVRHDGQVFNISRPRNANPDQGASFAGISQDGQTVFFTTTSQLVASDTDSANDIYAYHVASDTVTRITEGAEVTQIGAASKPWVQVSPGGDYVYFIATNQINGQGTAGNDNLYLYHDNTITYITTASNGTTALGQSMSNGDPSLTTPDGRHLLFFSRFPIVGPPTNGNYQLFQYSAVDQQIRCISCHPDGTAPTTSTIVQGKDIYPLKSADQRFQSDDGQTVAFETKERLLPADTNDTSDIYLWQRGTLSLISSPRVPNDIVGGLMSTTASGDSVYFTSTDRLTPGVDQDNLKLYVARLGGGFPVAPSQPACQQDECQGAPSAPPPAPSPASAAFNGAGNLAANPASPLPKKLVVKPLTKAQKLSRALRVCRKKTSHKQRKRCESTARRTFGNASRKGR